MKNISVIIVSWKSNLLLQKQLSLLQDKNIQTIVIDNSQTLKNQDLPKDTHLISNSYNKGYSAACNQGVIASTSKWLLFLNPDVFMTTKQCADLVKYAENNSLDALSPEPTSENYKKPIPTPLTFLQEFSPLGKLYSKNHDQKTLTGGALLIKRQVLLDLGGWDERFFLWFEDSDLSRRLLDAGYKIGFAPVEVNHIGGESFKTLPDQYKKDMFFNAMDIYVRKHLPTFTAPFTLLIKNRFTNSKIIPASNENLSSVVIPNLKQDLLDSFLQKNKKYILSKNLELIIVTSAISNINIWKYRKNYPNIRFIPISANWGFAKTVNIGLRAASGRFVGTINDDVILEANWLENLTKNLPENFGSVNPIIVDPKHIIESAGIKILPKGKAETIIRNPSSSLTQTDATNGAAVIYSKTALQRVGLFDERFGSYLEDLDLSLRLSRAGFVNLVQSAVTVTHIRHQTSSTISFNKAWYDAKNWWLVVFKNWTLQTWINFFPVIIIERMRNISGLLKSFK